MKLTTTVIITQTAYIFIPNLTAVENQNFKALLNHIMNVRLAYKHEILPKTSKSNLYYKLKRIKSAFLPHKAVVMGVGFKEHACQINGTHSTLLSQGNFIYKFHF